MVSVVLKIGGLKNGSLGIFLFPIFLTPILLHTIRNFSYVHFFLFKTTIEQKGLTIDYDFNFSFPLFTSLLKQKGKKKRTQRRFQRFGQGGGR